VIEFKQVQKRYSNGYDALKRVSLYIPQGSITFLTGHSGAGKSTLLRLISISEIATRGQVLVDDEDLSKLRGDQIALHRRNIGCVFQDHKLLQDRTVEENVALPLVVAGMSDRDCSRRARAALDKVGLLNLSKRYPLSLSAGEQQRVGIARAVVARPRILLADEPTGNLDPDLANEIMQLFFLFNQHDVTVVIATHDYRHVNNPAAGLLALKRGQIVGDRNS
jgi:cell division transport system ATP-binding protein